jgi:cyclopropane fatty-acyl-phospholipid synthase-like methyltransferase
MLSGDTTTGNPAEWWGEGDYELRERAYAPIHERLIERLDPQPGERVLDVACGLGAIAARAARAGAEVTAIDLAPVAAFRRRQLRRRGLELRRDLRARPAPRRRRALARLPLAPGSDRVDRRPGP